EVLEHLLGLRLHVAFADHLPVLVERDLARDEHHLRGARHFDDVRVAGRLRERGRVGAFHLSEGDHRKQHKRQRKHHTHRNLLMIRRSPSCPPPYPPVRPRFVVALGGAGRYSSCTLLTTAMGRPGCEYVAVPSRVSTISFSPSRLTRSSP